MTEASAFEAPRRMRWLLALPVAVAAGAVLDWQSAPLPWLIGPMLVYAVANVLNARLRTPVRIRTSGQSLIGMALGLYFTAPVLLSIGSLSGWIALALVLSFGLTIVGSLLFSRLGGLDYTTAYFCCTIGGAAEMANLAERRGARTEYVATAHALRVMLVVLILPFAFHALDLHGQDGYRPASLPFRPAGLVAQLALCLAAGAVLARLRVLNAWLFGPLLVSGALTATGHSLSSVTAWLVDCGQLMIGCSLGARFTPDILRDSPRFLFATAVVVPVLLLGCAGIGLTIGALSDIPMATAVLATAPGGLAEMGVTAKVLGLGVPVVISFHTVRLACTVLAADFVHRLLVRF